MWSITSACVFQWRTQNGDVRFTKALSVYPRGGPSWPEFSTLRILQGLGGTGISKFFFFQRLDCFPDHRSTQKSGQGELPCVCCLRKYSSDPQPVAPGVGVRGGHQPLEQTCKSCWAVNQPGVKGSLNFQNISCPTRKALLCVLNPPQEK